MLFRSPANTPAPAVLVLNDEIDRALHLPEVRERLSTIGLDPQTLSQGEFAGYVKSEMAKWAGIIKATGVRPD